MEITVEKLRSLEQLQEKLSNKANSFGAMGDAAVEARAERNRIRDGVAKNQRMFLDSLLRKKPTSKRLQQKVIYFDDVPTKVYERKKFMCFPGEKSLMLETPSKTGLMFQRPHKTGSTTVVGILLRLVHNRATKFEKCKHRSIHGTALSFQYGERMRGKSFLFSIIRDPTTRIISEFFHFKVSAGQKDPTDAAFLEYVQRSNVMNTYLHDLMTKNYTTNQKIGGGVLLRQFREYMGLQNANHQTREENSSPERKRKIAREWYSFKRANGEPAEKVVKDIIDEYDFIGVTERMDESLVVLQMLLNLTTKEILYTRARSSGTFSNGYVNRPCFLISPSFLTPTMQAWFEGEEWWDIIQNDVLLYQAANRTLDRTIAAFNEESPGLFDSKLARLKEGLKLANEHCKGNIRSMCTDGGKKIFPVNTTCYIWAVSTCQDATGNNLHCRQAQLKISHLPHFCVTLRRAVTMTALTTWSLTINAAFGALLRRNTTWRTGIRYK